MLMGTGLLVLNLSPLTRYDDGEPWMDKSLNFVIPSLALVPLFTGMQVQCIK